MTETQMLPAALACSGLRKTFGGSPVVDGLDLEAQPGELVALLGPSGCGKTTCLRMIAGFEPIDAGRITIGGRVVADAAAGSRRADPPEQRRVGMVFQDYALFPHLSVAKNVGFGLKGGSQQAAAVHDALAAVGLAGYADRMPDALSGGQQQRVALARALAPRPDLVLLDEPFSNLDAELRVALRQEVREILRAANATAVLVTHDQEEALSLADRIAVMWGGKVLQQGSPEELYLRPANRTVAGFVGDAQFLPGEATGRRATTDLGEVPLHAPATGTVDVMVRPEQLRLTPATVEEPGNAVVVSRAFFGHDQLLTIALLGGRTLRARLGAYGGIRPGDRVTVSVRGAALAFPQAEGTSSSR